MSWIMPEFLTPDKLQRMAWEHRNAHKFQADFKATQQAGCDRHGMRFVKAQEAAIAAVSGGIFETSGDWSDVERAFVSRLVLSVLDEAKGK